MEKSHNSEEGSVTNTTNIGNVTGQVHTGSGNIIVSGFTANTIISTKEEFLSALRRLKIELESVRQQGFPQESTKQAIAEVETAEEEAAKDKPKAQTIAERLEKVKTILLAGTGIATATTAAVTAIGKLLPMIDTAINYVSKIFH